MLTYFVALVLLGIPLIWIEWGLGRHGGRWRSIHEGADIRIPRVFKFIITWVTPVYLVVILVWWGVTDALLAARGLLIALGILFLLLIRYAWRRNRRDDRAGLPEVPQPGVGAAR